LNYTEKSARSSFVASPNIAVIKRRDGAISRTRLFKVG
jgi:hypothetical protein